MLPVNGAVFSDLLRPSLLHRLRQKARPTAANDHACNAGSNLRNWSSTITRSSLWPKAIAVRKKKSRNRRRKSRRRHPRLPGGAPDGTPVPPHPTHCALRRSSDARVRFANVHGGIWQTAAQSCARLILRQTPLRGVGNPVSIQHQHRDHRRRSGGPARRRSGGGGRSVRNAV